MSGTFRYSEAEVRAAVAASLTYTEALRRLGLRTAGGNYATIRKYVEVVWKIPTVHFDPNAARSIAGRRRAVPLCDVLVEGSSYNRVHLKKRLLAEGLKEPRCELCGQGDVWRGRPMSLVLDHANGVHDDHRIKNLRIVCPNCNATLDTHCGKHNRRKHPDRACPTCASVFRPRNGGHRYCSHACAGLAEAQSAGATRAAPRRAPAVRAAPDGDQGARLPRGGSPIRRERQRDPQVAARVRGRGRAQAAPCAPAVATATTTGPMSGPGEEAVTTIAV